MKWSGVFIWFIVIGSLISSGFLVQGASASELQVNFATNPMVVAPGTNGFIEVILKSIGVGTVNDINIEVSSWDSSVVMPRGNWKVYVGDLAGGDSTSIFYEFQVSDSASPGLYQIVFIIDYYPGKNIRQTLMVQVEDPTILDLVSVVPTSINVGEVTTLAFNVSNKGATTAGNILFTWEDSDNLILPVGSDNRITVSSIAGGNYTLIPVDVIASPLITPGAYPLTITIEFYDRTGTKQIVVSEVGLQIGGTTDFEIVPQQSTASSTTFAIANTGANVASSVIVSIPQQISYITSGVSSVSLGNLDAGDYTLATFQITSSQRSNDTQSTPFEGRPGNLPPDFDPSMMEEFRNRSFMDTGNANLIVEISYTDLFGVRQTIEKEVILSSFSSASVNTSDMASRFAGRDTGQFSVEGADNGTTYIILGVVGIIVIVAILKFNKIKKLKLPRIAKLLKGKKNENS